MTGIILDTLTLMIIADVSEDTEKAVKYTASNLQNIIFSRRFKDNCINDLVESFSIELLSNDTKISACGYFNINFKTFAKVRLSCY